MMILLLDVLKILKVYQRLAMLFCKILRLNLKKNFLNLIN